jgi:hypothetical protein
MGADVVDAGDLAREVSLGVDGLPSEEEAGDDPVRVEHLPDTLDLLPCAFTVHTEEHRVSHRAPPQ